MHCYTFAGDMMKSILLFAGFLALLQLCTGKASIRTVIYIAPLQVRETSTSRLSTIPKDGK